MPTSKTAHITEVKHWIDGKNTYKNESIQQFRTKITVQAENGFVHGENIEAAIVRHNDQVKLVYWHSYDGVKVEMHRAFDTAQSEDDIEVLESAYFEFLVVSVLVDADPVAKHAIDNPTNANTPAQQCRETIPQ